MPRERRWWIYDSRPWIGNLEHCVLPSSKVASSTGVRFNLHALALRFGVARIRLAFWLTLNVRWACASASLQVGSGTSGYLTLGVRQRKPAGRDVGSGVSLASWQRSQATFFSKGRSVDSILSNVLRSVLAQDALLNEEPGYRFHSRLSGPLSQTYWRNSFGLFDCLPRAAALFRKLQVAPGW